MKRVYTLYRVSTAKQVDVTKDDIPMQRIACHEFYDRQPDWEILREFEDCQKIVLDTLGVKMYYFRPPFGKADDRMYRLIPAPFVLCGASGGDGRKLVHDAQFRIERFMSKVYDGCIGLLHCFEGNTETVKALETILPQLKAQGYRIVTLTQLYQASGLPLPPPAQGVFYRDNKPTP